MSEQLTDNDVTRVMERLQSACTDAHTVINQFRYDANRAERARRQAEEQLEKREQARQEAEKRVDYWKSKYHHTCESEEDYKQRAEAAEADAARLRGALRRLYRANSLNAFGNELADAMVQARDAVVCDQPEPQSEPDTAEGRANALYDAIRECLIEHVCGETTHYYLTDVLGPRGLSKLADDLAVNLQTFEITAQTAEQGAGGIYVPTDNEIKSQADEIMGSAQAVGFEQGARWTIERVAALNAKPPKPNHASNNEGENQ